MKKSILMIALVAISVNLFAGNKVANRNQPKTYIDARLANVESQTNVTYLHSYVKKHISFLGSKYDCMDTVRVFSCNGYEFSLDGNFSTSNTADFDFKADANLLIGRDLNILKIELPASSFKKEGGNWHVEYMMRDLTPIDENTVIVRFDAYSAGKEELCAIAVNRLTGEITQADPNSVTNEMRRYHGGRAWDHQHRFAETHTAKDAQGNKCLVAIWR